MIWLLKWIVRCATQRSKTCCGGVVTELCIHMGNRAATHNWSKSYDGRRWTKKMCTRWIGIVCNSVILLWLLGGRGDMPRVGWYGVIGMMTMRIIHHMMMTCLRCSSQPQQDTTHGIRSNTYGTAFDSALTEIFLSCLYVPQTLSLVQHTHFLRHTFLGVLFPYPHGNLSNIQRAQHTSR